MLTFFWRQAVPPDADVAVKRSTLFALMSSSKARTTTLLEVGGARWPRGDAECQSSLLDFNRLLRQALRKSQATLALHEKVGDVRCR